MTGFPYPAGEYRYPGFRWLTGHPVLDALLTLWRDNQNWPERRPPRYSEIGPLLLIPGCANFVLARDPGGMRPPICDGLFPSAAVLLGLPRDFGGTDWRDKARSRKVGTLVRKVARGQAAARGMISAGPRTYNPGGPLVALGVPLAPEPQRAAGRDRGVILAVAWPVRGV
ncbi:hypothetical protein JL101_034495 (plasmid) [Skermanella rosea]|uniref:hypothetical protein n=1 Tax=Skermanella rosea TaxID=1817965 RepID=UPI00193418FC|nr:hypothetical protein [Skermanella rosea]UEM07967.1 hypothetical protein JL101_034495 [Skermanella rosea]